MFTTRNSPRARFAASSADDREPVRDPALEPAVDLPTRPAWRTLLAGAIGLVVLAALWRYTPLSVLASSEEIVNQAERLAGRFWMPIAVIAAYTPASLVMFPRPLITLFAVMVFGAWMGFALAFCGILLAAALTFALGRGLEADFVLRMAGTRVHRLLQILSRGGIASMTLVRMLPIAPFVVVNVVAGAIRLRWWHFMAGSALGILPGTLTATVFGEQVVEGLRDPRSVNPGAVAAAVIALLLLAYLLRRWALRSQSPRHEPGDRQSVE